MARCLPDGKLEFRGRRDDEVKVRGFRVDLGEIQSALDAHPSVRRSVVVRRARGTAAALVAYVVGAVGRAPDPDELRRYVRARLPAYMEPAHWVVLDSIPLTPAGKIDRERLPSPNGDHANVARSAVVPRTDTEEALCGVWTQALGLEQLSVRDNFFDVGGESLAAMQVTAATNKLFATDLSVRAVFDAPTVESLAALIDAARLRSAHASPTADDHGAGIG
jgi:nonribosomal peptide synthetase protein BlmX